MSKFTDAIERIERHAKVVQATIHPLASIEMSISLRHFRKTENPIFAWKVYERCRFAGLTIPQDIFVYLDSVAAEILRLAKDRPKEDQKVLAGLARALGLRKNKAGPGGFFEKYESYWKKRRIGLEVHEEKEKHPGADIKELCRIVGKKHGKSGSRAFEYYRNYLKEGEVS